MARSPKQKMKLLFLLQMLTEHTDEKHALTTQEIIERLAREDIHAERKSIYDDIRILQDFGYDIVQISTRQGGGYYLGGRDFELAELKLLVDAVQSSRFITTRKSRALIKKLEHMVSRHDAGKLQRQVYVAGRIKTENESIYYSIDAVHRAIQENLKISFAYMDWTIEKELKPRKGKDIYVVSPWALIWREENYYMVAYDSSSDAIKHYRVDKMGKVSVLKEKREGAEKFADLDISVYANSTFGMYGGIQEIVTMRFPIRLIGVVIDRFGKDIDVRKELIEQNTDDASGEQYLRCRVKVKISNQFFGWLVGIGKDIQIVSPKHVKEEYIKLLTEIVNTL